MPIEFARDRRAERQFMRRHVVAVRVRHESAWLTPPRVDGKVDAGDLQALVKVKHAIPCV